MKIPIFTLLAAIFFAKGGDAAFPSYSQQCADDAGPPFEDDSDHYGNNGYHFGSAAQPVLKSNGRCADPIQGACDARGDAKTAYLEGPIDCGNNGWYCRIIPDENWPPIALTSDVNFGYCNQTGGFEDPGYDRDGHCHGSDADSTYYWWMRDHWFRQYNGHLRCCCNWETGSDPLTAGRITNRCDYRKELQPGENTSCRDANEEHNKGFNGGCDPSFGDEQLGKPLVENDAQCWEVTRFGFSEGNDGGDNGDDNDGGDDGDDNDGGDGDCVDQPLAFKNKAKLNCDWVGKNTRKRCSKKWKGKALSEYCPASCGADCGDDNGGGDDDESEDEDEDEDEDTDCADDPEFRFKDKSKYNCAWVGKKAALRCNKKWEGARISTYCPQTCGSCRRYLRQA